MTMRIPLLLIGVGIGALCILVPPIGLAMLLFAVIFLVFGLLACAFGEPYRPKIYPPNDRPRPTASGVYDWGDYSYEDRHE